MLSMIVLCGKSFLRFHLSYIYFFYLSAHMCRFWDLYFSHNLSISEQKEMSFYYWKIPVMTSIIDFTVADYFVIFL